MKEIYNNGYKVVNAYKVERPKNVSSNYKGLYIVIAHNESKECPQPWVCWYMEDDGYKRSFYWGKYSQDDIFPKQEFIKRIISEERLMIEL